MQVLIDIRCNQTPCLEDGAETWGPSAIQTVLAGLKCPKIEWNSKISSPLKWERMERSNAQDRSNSLFITTHKDESETALDGNDLLQLVLPESDQVELSSLTDEISSRWLAHKI